MGNRINSVLSLTALVVAIGGATPVGEAAWNQLVPRNSVGTLQLKRNSVTSSKIAPNSVRTAHVVNGALLAADFKEGQLPSGPKGDKGEKGDRGPVGTSGYEIVRASTNVPANTIAAAQARCPNGKKVIGGAASVQGVPSGVWLHTGHTEFPGGDSYDVIAVNTTASPQQVNSLAFCANVAE